RNFPPKQEGSARPCGRGGQIRLRVGAPRRTAFRWASDPRVPSAPDALLNYRRQRRGSHWLDFPADSHPEEVKWTPKTGSPVRLQFVPVPVLLLRSERSRMSSGCNLWGVPVKNALEAS